MCFLFGPSIGYNIRTAAKGNGWGFYNQTQIDTNGNRVSIITERNWEKNDLNSKDLSRFNLGFVFGLDFLIPLNKRVDLIFENKYNIVFTNITTLTDLRYTSLFTGYVTAGLRYKLH